jgi:hypothetical protein
MAWWIRSAQEGATSLTKHGLWAIAANASVGTKKALVELAQKAQPLWAAVFRGPPIGRIEQRKATQVSAFCDGQERQPARGQMISSLAAAWPEHGGAEEKRRAERRHSIGQHRRTPAASE